MSDFADAFKAATKEYTHAAVQNAFEHDEFEVVEDEIYYQTRWSIVNRAVIKYDDKYYAVIYETPATEYQEGGDFDDYQIYEVTPVEKTVIQYVKKQ